MEQLHSKLAEVALHIIAAPRGILAADQNGEEMGSILTKAGGSGGWNERLAFRVATLSADGLGKYVGGVILHHESVTCKEADFAKLLANQGVALGGTVDQGHTYLAATKEPVTRGFEALPECLKAYKSLGCTFVKWRTIVQVSSSGLPSREALDENLDLSARYAAAAQKNGLVPICEPDLQFSGDHDEERFRQVAETVWRVLFQKLSQYNVYLPGIILKTCWIVPGFSCTTSSCNDADCAQMTVETLAKVVPKEIAGIAFLSGGMTLDRCLELLRLVNVAAKEQGADYRFTFSYGRALLEEPALQFTKGNFPDGVGLTMVEQVRLTSKASVI